MSSKSSRTRVPAGPVSRMARVTAAVGVAAAMIIALLINVWSARHYRRIDVTTSKLYTLSPATVC